MAPLIKLPRPPRALTQQLALRPEELSLLARRAQRSGTTAERVTLADVDHWLATVPLDDPERTALLNLREAAVGDGRTSKARGFGPEDISPADFRSFAKPADVVGEPEVVQKLRRELPSALWGQEQALPGFLRLADDFVSPLQEQPPVLAISGPVGHGKDGAVEALRRALLGEDSELARVDLSQVRDGDHLSLFGEGGPLSHQRAAGTADAVTAAGDDAVEEAADGDAVEGVVRPLLVHLTGVDDLQTRAPKIAQELSKRFLATEGEPDHAFVNYVVDFDALGDPQALMAAALGREGSQVLSGVSEFKRLDAPTLQRYAEEVALPRILKTPELGRIFLELDDDAREVLGKALATPDAPLVQLEDRLERFLLKHFDTQTSLDRGDSVLRVRLAPELARDADALDAKLASLMDRPGAPAPDLSAGSELFWVTRVAKSDGLSLAQVDTLESDARSALAAAAGALDDLLPRSGAPGRLKARSPEALATAELKERLASIERQLSELSNQARSSVTMKLANVAPEGRVRALREELEALSGAAESATSKLQAAGVDGVDAALSQVRAAEDAVAHSLDTLTANAAQRPGRPAPVRASVPIEDVVETQRPMLAPYVTTEQLVAHLMAADRAYTPLSLDELLDEAHRRVEEALGLTLPSKAWLRGPEALDDLTFSVDRALLDFGKDHSRIVGTLARARDLPGREGGTRERALLFELLTRRAKAAANPDSVDATRWATDLQEYQQLRETLLDYATSPAEFASRWKDVLSSFERRLLSVAAAETIIEANSHGRSISSAIEPFLEATDFGPGYRLVEKKDVLNYVKERFPLSGIKDTHWTFGPLQELTGITEEALERFVIAPQFGDPWLILAEDAPILKVTKRD